MENKDLELGAQYEHVGDIDADQTTANDVQENESEDPQMELDIPVCPQPSYKVYDNADFMLKCSCGAEKMIAENISGGMQYVVPATDSHTLDIQCPECLTKITFYFKEHVVEESPQDEDVNSENNEHVPQEDKDQE